MSKPTVESVAANERPILSEQLDAVFTALTEALSTIGAGAKTAVGYGRWLAAGTED